MEEQPQKLLPDDSLKQDTVMLRIASLTSASQLAALLWNTNNTVKLVTFDKSTGIPSPVFECTPDQISNASVTGAILEFTVNGTAYFMDFSPNAKGLFNVGMMGKPESFLTKSQQEQIGISWWAEKLAAQNITVGKHGKASLVRIGLILLVVIVILLSFIL